MKKLLTLCSSQSAVLSLALMSVSNLSYGAFVLTLDDPNDGVAALTIYDLTSLDSAHPVCGFRSQRSVAPASTE